VLSQKPFVLDLDVGRKLVELADQRKLKLAVNQNARWAPHFSYMRAAVRQGVIGQLQSVHFGEHWDHNWTFGTKFENVRHLILYDYAIHWFDMLTCLMQDRQPQRVYASFTRSATQQARPALLGQAVVEYEGAQASLVFDGDTRHGPLNTSFIAGTLGTLTSHGPNYNEQRVTLTIGDHRISPLLQGTWFPGGFHGTMGELLRAIEEDRPAEHAAANNLQSLALCYAAVASAEGQQPVVPGSVQRMPAEWHTP
jgi:predicted dehydrogenase